MQLTHPGLVFWRAPRITKAELARYYERIAERALPHIACRPLTLVRCPYGAEAECFVQRHSSRAVPRAVHRAGGGSGKRGRHLYVDTVGGLVALVQAAVLEIHVWGARIDRLDRPDRLVFDLDPGPGVGWGEVVASACAVRQALESFDLQSFPKTTGGRGVHVVVPLTRRNEWDEARGFARAIAERLARERPERFTARASKAERPGRIYVDYLRNARGASAVAPYSTRARPGAPVSTPVTWDELCTSLRPAVLDTGRVIERLAAGETDPWRDMARVRQSITAGILRDLGVKGVRET